MQQDGDTLDIGSVEALRSYSLDQLQQFADELRQETIRAVSVSGGHLGASLAGR